MLKFASFLYNVLTNKKVQGGAVLLLFLAILPVTIIVSQIPQTFRQQAESNCQTGGNLIQNCDMSQGSGQLPDNFFDAATDPKRAAGPGQYNSYLKTVDIDGTRSIEIGKENGTCELSKLGAGGENDKLRLFSEARTYGTVGNASNFHLSFEFKMKSKHTRKNSSPFYAWVGFARNPDDGRDDQGKGREAVVAFTPHDDGAQDQYCNSPFRQDYTCWIGLYNISRDQNVNCNDIDTTWRKVDVDFTRNSICQDPSGNIDLGCVAKNKEVFIGFGVGNDYDTVVDIRNVILTADGKTAPPPNANTPTPTITPKPPTNTPTPTQKPVETSNNPTCSTQIIKTDESNPAYNLISVGFSGIGGNVTLQMGQKGDPGADTSNPFSLNGFLSQNLGKGLSANDNAKLPNTSISNSGLGQFTSDSVFVDNTLTDFKIYVWDKKFKKSPNSTDFLTGKETGFWYFIDYYDGKTKTCSKNNISIRVPKNKRVFFMCSVRDYDPDRLVCIGNPVCSYNGGPDVGAIPDYACLAWKKSCSNNDFVYYEGQQNAASDPASGLEIKAFQPNQ